MKLKTMIPLLLVGLFLIGCASSSQNTVPIQAEGETLIETNNEYGGKTVETLYPKDKRHVHLKRIAFYDSQEIKRKQVVFFQVSQGRENCAEKATILYDEEGKSVKSIFTDKNGKVMYEQCTQPQ